MNQPWQDAKLCYLLNRFMVWHKMPSYAVYSTGSSYGREAPSQASFAVAKERSVDSLLKDLDNTSPLARYLGFGLGL